MLYVGYHGIYHSAPRRLNEVPSNYRRIHMPKPLHDEIVKFVLNSKYETVAELCREAGRLLVEHHRLRERYA
jgi:hypothetical protein